MDARCYGAGGRRTSHHDGRMTPSAVIVLVGGVALCLVLACALSDDAALMALVRGASGARGATLQ